MALARVFASFPFEDFFNEDHLWKQQSKFTTTRRVFSANTEELANELVQKYQKDYPNAKIEVVRQDSVKKVYEHKLTAVGQKVFAAYREIDPSITEDKLIFIPGLNKIDTRFAERVENELNTPRYWVSVTY
jgi:hypothetical protein